MPKAKTPTSKIKRPKIVTLAWIRDRIQEIKDVAHDAEAAHIREDQLRAIVLKAIAEHACRLPGACAKGVLESDKIKFGRYCS